MSESLTWITSTHSASGNCVEVAGRDDLLLRDPKDRYGPVLRFTL